MIFLTLLTAFAAAVAAAVAAARAAIDGRAAVAVVASVGGAAADFVAVAAAVALCSAHARILRVERRWPPVRIYPVYPDSRVAVVPLLAKTQC